MALINTGIGISQKENLIEAAREAANEAKEKIGSKKPKLLMCFLTLGAYPEKDYQKALNEIYNVFEDRDIPLVGGPVIGFFTKGRYYLDVNLMGKYLGLLLKGVEKIVKPFKKFGFSVIALSSEYLSVGVGIGENAFLNPQKAGKEAIEMALENLEYNPSIAYLAMLKKGAKDITRFRPLNAILLTPGNNEKGLLSDQQFIEGITSVTKRTTRIIGGGLCSSIKIEKKGIGFGLPSLQFFNGKVYQNSLICVVFGSDLEIGFGTFVGAQSLGKIMLVTKSKGNIVEEIDGKSASERLKEIYKEAGIREDPIIIGTKGILPARQEASTGFLWPVIPIKYEGKSVVFMNSIKENTILVLSKITKESSLNATLKACELVKEDAGTDDFGFIFYFSCPLRGRILGTKYPKEISFIEKVFNKENLPIFGISSAGEIAFYKLGQPFGATATITMMGISNQLISEVRS